MPSRKMKSFRIEQGVTNNRVRRTRPDKAAKAVLVPRKRKFRDPYSPDDGDVVTPCISMSSHDLEVLDAVCERDRIERSTFIRRAIHRAMTGRS